MEPVQIFICKVVSAIISPIITLLALASFIVFIWGVVEMLANSEKADEARKKGQQHMLWGIIGLVIIFGSQALTWIIARTAGFQGTLFFCGG